MAVVMVTTINRYVGLAADAKPAAPPAGSTFYCTDSGLAYVFDGTAWQLDSGRWYTP